MTATVLEARTPGTESLGSYRCHCSMTGRGRSSRPVFLLVYWFHMADDSRPDEKSFIDGRVQDYLVCATVAASSAKHASFPDLVFPVRISPSRIDRAPRTGFAPGRIASRAIDATLRQRAIRPSKLLCA